MQRPKTPRELALRDAIQDVFSEWAADGGLRANVPVAWVVIVEGSGFDEDGDSTETTMIIPSGSSNQILGLLDNCRIRIGEDILESIRNSSD